MFAGFEDAEQSFAAWFDPGSGFDERYVHHGHDQSILRHMFEVIFDEGELFFAESCAVEFFLSVAHPVNIVDGNEVHGAVVEREVRWSVDSFVGFIAEFVIFGGVVDVVVADDVVPGDADVAEGAIEIIEQAEVVEQNIAESDAEGRLGSGKFLNDIVGDEVDFLLISGLWVAKEDDIEGGGFRGMHKWEVDGSGQRSRRGNSGEVQFG